MKKFIQGSSKSIYSRSTQRHHKTYRVFCSPVSCTIIAFLLVFNLCTIQKCWLASLHVPLSVLVCVCEYLCMCAFTLFKHDSHCLLSLLKLTCCRCRCLCLCRCQHSALTSLHCFSVEQGDHDAASVGVALVVVLLLPLLLFALFCFLLLFCVLCHHLAVSCQRRLERVNCYFAAPTLQAPSLGWTSPTLPLPLPLPSFVPCLLQFSLYFSLQRLPLAEEPPIVWLGH